MIEGLKVTVTGSELISLCDARAAYHAKRASFYREQVKNMPPEDAAQFAKSGNNSPVETMVERAEKHEADGAEMTFIATHLQLNEDYQLARGDLARIGVVKGHYF